MDQTVRGFEAFDEIERLIVVAAHPDDLETMCGGTILQLVRRGVQVYSVNCTLGDIGAQDASLSRPALASTRLAETEAAAKLLGLAGTFNLGHHDGELLPDLTLRAQIARLYRVTQADTLWTFDPYWAGQIHPDHRAAGQAALDAYMPSKMPLYHPEQLAVPGAEVGRLQRVFLFAPGNDAGIIIDVTPDHDAKLSACAAHVSQFPDGLDSLEWLRALDGERGKAIGAQYAEAFRQMSVW